MRPGTFECITADSVEEVLSALADGDTAVLAGGQSLALETTPRVVDINRVPGLDLLGEQDGVLRVGPLVRHRVFESHAVGGPMGDLMRLVVCHIGHPPVRARGTMLGSLAYAHPAAEWPVVAVMLGARFVLAGPRGSRTVPAEAFFTGPFTTLRRPDELLVEVCFPALRAGTGVGYAEDRRTTVFPQAAAMATVTATGGVVEAASIGLVNAAPCPVRARAAERVLLGRPLSDSAIAEATAVIEVAAFRTLVRRALSQARTRMRSGAQVGLQDEGGGAGR
jgi:aerobic carbon-monoxide dehydrogenase medium subunit